MNRMKAADITQLRYLFDKYYRVFYNKKIIENPESIFSFLSSVGKKYGTKTMNVAPDPGTATQTSTAGRNAHARPTPVRCQSTWTPLSSFTASDVSDVAPTVSSAASLSVAPDVLASAVSQVVGQVLQPLIERVE